MSVTRIWDGDAATWRIVGGTLAATAALGYLPGDPIYFTASGSFVKANYPGMVAAIVECQGGGGSGGNTTNTGGSQWSAAGGGNGGNYARKLVLASDLDATEAVTVGAGGAAVAGAGANGNNGGDSIFDTISGEVRAIGGYYGLGHGVLAGGGFIAGTGSWGEQAIGASAGDLIIRGGRGKPGYSIHPPVGHGMGGAGGGSFMAQESNEGYTNTTQPSPGKPYGGGGSGAGSAASSSAYQGSPGGAGIVIVTPLYATSGGPAPSGGYLPLTGGTLSGALTLAADPTAALHAATKQYADLKVPLAGGTMSGLLVLSADPSAALGAATKQYVDARVGGVGFLPTTGGTMTGFISLHANPSSALHAATKQYVDSQDAAHIHDGRYYTEAETEARAEAWARYVTHTDLFYQKSETYHTSQTYSSGQSEQRMSDWAATCLRLNEGGSVWGNSTFQNNLYINYAHPNNLLPGADWPYGGASNGSLRYLGVGTHIYQNNGGPSSVADKKGITDIDLSKSIFSRLDPIWFQYKETSKWKAKFRPEDWEKEMTPPEGRMGFTYEQMKEVAPQWTYETEAGMPSIGYDAMIPDFIAWATAAIKSLLAEREATA